MCINDITKDKLGLYIDFKLYKQFHFFMPYAFFYQESFKILVTCLFNINIVYL